MATIEQLRARLCDGLTIPACPLALNAQRKLDERRQRALFRYYIAAGSGGLAVAVHTTQFAIRDPKIGLFRPVLELASEEMARAQTAATTLARIAGICGSTKQAVAEATLVRELGFHAGLPSLGALESAGNDDNIVMDLIIPFRFKVDGKTVERRIVGGLLGHWAVWTKKGVELHTECRRVARSGKVVPVEMLRRSVEVTDANAAFFDAANGYTGCIPGIHEGLRRQGLLEGIWCLDPKETLSAGQLEEIDRVYRAYPHLNDDDFVAQNRDKWLGRESSGGVDRYAGAGQIPNEI